jgi:hypothetical protein
MRALQDLCDYLAAGVRAVLAVAVGLLPARHWEAFESLPVRAATIVSGYATTVAGLVIGGRGLAAYLRRAGDAAIDATIELTARQVRGEVPATDVTTWDLQRLSIFSFVAFVLFTPLGLFALYLVLSGAVRAIAGWVEQPIGDPLLTGLDNVAMRTTRSIRARRAEAHRNRAEGPDVADRLFSGEWAGLQSVDYVVVASRRKPDWVAGTFVITSDKWYTLGEPFDMHLPDGLRTIYPLTEQKVTEVLRRGVAYELPPLSRPPRRSPKKAPYPR